MNRLHNYLLILLAFVALQANGQTSDYEGAVDKLVKKNRKERKDSLVDRINDSTARTYEFSQKTGKLLLACNKQIHAKVKSEYHFDYKDDVLIRVSVSVLDFTGPVGHASFTTYYFKDGELVSASPPELIGEMKRSAVDILAKADIVYRRWKELAGGRFR